MVIRHSQIFSSVVSEPRLDSFWLGFGSSFWPKSSARLALFLKKLGFQKFAKTSFFSQNYCNSLTYSNIVRFLKFLSLQKVCENSNWSINVVQICTPYILSCGDLVYSCLAFEYSTQYLFLHKDLNSVSNSLILNCILKFNTNPI